MHQQIVSLENVQDLSTVMSRRGHFQYCKTALTEKPEGEGWEVADVTLVPGTKDIQSLVWCRNVTPDLGDTQEIPAVDLEAKPESLSDIVA